MLLKLKTMSVPKPDALVVGGYPAIEDILTKKERLLFNHEYQQRKAEP
jgi:hypothetical protein